ncbi:hypothetical protein KEJ49_08035 [Candidatus Bathyarchaeota archaeon]|nr:hypothetical protein [Candidatus Bathyarchaeota archaeon]
MAWGWRGRGGGWAGPWPGRGSFSHLPPWQRPGWTLWMGARYGEWPRGYPISPWLYTRFPRLPRWGIRPEEELAELEDYKRMLEEERAELEREISDIEARMRELRTRKESEGDEGISGGPRH